MKINGKGRVLNLVCQAFADLAFPRKVNGATKTGVLVAIDFPPGSFRKLYSFFMNSSHTKRLDTEEKR